MAPHVSENQVYMDHYSKSSGMLSVSKDSHSVGKPSDFGGSLTGRRDWQTTPGATMQAPTIRVIHIFAPKVIKTDVANFRSTVQRLTGRGCKKASTGGGSQRRSRTKTLGGSNSCSNPTATNSGDERFPTLKDQQKSHQEVLQRLVNDACGADLVRCDSMESTYSMDSGNFSGDSNTSSETDLQSPAGSNFTFYTHRQTPYSLNEIPAPFFVTDSIHPCDTIAVPAVSPAVAQGSSSAGTRDTISSTSIMDINMSTLGFSADMDDLSSGPGSMLPLPDFLNIAPQLGTSSSGLYEMFMPSATVCRLSVQTPVQGTNFFEY